MSCGLRSDSDWRAPLRRRILQAIHPSIPACFAAGLARLYLKLVLALQTPLQTPSPKPTTTTRTGPRQSRVTLAIIHKTTPTTKLAAIRAASIVGRRTTVRRKAPRYITLRRVVCSTLWVPTHSIVNTQTSLLVDLPIHDWFLHPDKSPGVRTPLFVLPFRRSNCLQAFSGPLALYCVRVELPPMTTFTSTAGPARPANSTTEQHLPPLRNFEPPGNGRVIVACNEAIATLVVGSITPSSPFSVARPRARASLFDSGTSSHGPAATLQSCRRRSSAQRSVAYASRPQLK
ncbi:uncharacterized protein LY79DRAFT_105395 [Colletotrichum navitas]|uniref:Uncharacterized protein n=1 Tax=Colletotrichum navitas TaxID=681940 RepID=A0AAD8UXT5_9PEZI|nr:uncharacterized protein LY79DRAFT_105395 [Colletotrichum navitas]KAK1566134.1 hypothetical protein LY79DRAFT_105395 [Colletotrichum navitas]